MSILILPPSVRQYQTVTTTDIVFAEKCCLVIARNILVFYKNKERYRLFRSVTGAIVSRHPPHTRKKSLELNQIPHFYLENTGELIKYRKADPVGVALNTRHIVEV